MTPLPVAELHVHVEGTLEAELLVSLARRNGVALPTYDPVALAGRYRHFTNLQSFLDVYYANLAVLRAEEDFYDLMAAYLRRAAAAGVRRAEVFFDPQTHLNNGIGFETMVNGLSAAAQDAPIAADLILCFLRDLGPEAAEETLRAALPFREHFIGVGLDSAEVGHPPRLFKRVYEMAAGEGLHKVAHAGEEAGPDYVWEALDVLGVERIDHGVRALADPELVARLRAERVPLTVCPLSNLCLKGVSSLSEHPLKAMLDAGLLVTVNSDDPAYFGGHVDDNFAAVRSALSLTDEDLRQLARNSFEASFIDDGEKKRWQDAVDAFPLSQCSAGKPV
ncbi:adenosine deaminase [Segniliparus rotundus DSM 44985]|uniref:Adenine deaminase n=1 Tax=Segniliparus rotundus (strain ATCC BAA-972 / CDC 1076 / CIP 108378 / DSM 44985 / JCM 13578) TaxID=640132 RepID=D6Z8R4_SEGRD|nr:adenosine deaminase [Segniliparus rotundus]ADG98344.1 adenosine deaminase [Segniliparus rotundus DSM 44985]